RDELDPQLVDAESLLDLLDDLQAQVDRIADRQAARVQVRERERAFAVAEGDAPRVLDLLQRAGELLGRCRKGLEQPESEDEQQAQHGGSHAAATAARPRTGSDSPLPSSPSHFATTAVAMLLPITFVAERP